MEKDTKSKMTDEQEKYLMDGSWVEIAAEEKPRKPHQIIGFENAFNQLKYKLDNGRCYWANELEICDAMLFEYKEKIYSYLEELENNGNADISDQYLYNTPWMIGSGLECNVIESVHELQYRIKRDFPGRIIKDIQL